MSTLCLARARGEDINCVAVPLGGINIHSKRSNFSKVGQDCFLVIWGQGVVTRQSHCRCSCLDVEGAVARLSGLTRGVRPALFKGVTEQLKVTEPKLGN